MLRNLVYQPTGNNPATGQPFPAQNFTVSVAETLTPGSDSGTAFLNVSFSGFDASFLGVDVPAGLSSVHQFYVADDLPLSMSLDAVSLYLGHLLADSHYGPFFVCTDVGVGSSCGFMSDSEFNAKYGQQMADASAYTPPPDPGTPGNPPGSPPGSPGHP